MTMMQPVDAFQVEPAEVSRMDTIRSRNRRKQSKFPKPVHCRTAKKHCRYPFSVPRRDGGKDTMLKCFDLLLTAKSIFIKQKSRTCIQTM